MKNPPHPGIGLKHELDELGLSVAEAAGAKLIEMPVVKATELRRQAAERSDQREFRGDEVNDSAEPRLLGESKAVFGFALHLGQRFAGEEKGHVQSVAREGSVYEVSDPVRRLESASQQITAVPHVFHPGHDETRESFTGARLEALEPASFDEFVAELAKSKSGPGVAEMRYGDRAQPDIGDT